jgi:hypothetical protein
MDYCWVFTSQSHKEGKKKSLMWYFFGIVCMKSHSWIESHTYIVEDFAYMPILLSFEWTKRRNFHQIYYDSLDTKWRCITKRYCQKSFIFKGVLTNGSMSIESMATITKSCDFSCDLLLYFLGAIIFGGQKKSSISMVCFFWNGYGLVTKWRP